MDRDSGLDNFATLLKPGGTLAAWFYGRPTFSDPTLRTDAQPLLDRIMVLNWQKVIADSSAGSSPRRAWGFKRCADAMASWAGFPALLIPRVWSHVRRYKWNYTSSTLPFFGAEACGYPIAPTSHVRAGEDEEVVVAEDAAFLAQRVGFRGVAGVFPGAVPRVPGGGRGGG